MPENRGSNKAVTLSTLAPEEIKAWGDAWHQFQVQSVHTRDLQRATDEMGDRSRNTLIIAMLECQDAFKKDDKATALHWAWLEIRRLGLIPDPWAKPMSDKSWLRAIGITPYKTR